MPAGGAKIIPLHRRREDPADATERPAPRASPLSGEDDARLVTDARGGDGAALRSLYDRWRPAVFRVACGFGHLDRDDAEDVVQDAFVRAFRHLGKLEQPARFGPWLLMIARNCALSRLARRKAGSELADGLACDAEAQGGEAGPPAEPEVEAELALVRRIIDELPDGPEKETVRLFYVEGNLSAAEIAARFGVGKSAITMRLERFRAKVKARVLAELARLRGEG
jgi:RNA polymerase sigma-70 factor (ECF subfamily)